MTFDPIKSKICLWSFYLEKTVEKRDQCKNLLNSHRTLLEHAGMKMWSPSAEQIQNANLTKLTTEISGKVNQKFPDFSSFYEWSVKNPDQFWEEVMELCQFKHSKGWETVLKKGKEIHESLWFSGLEFNFAENLLRFSDSRVAIKFWGEDKIRKTLTYQELYGAVAKVASYLKGLGVSKGDRVAGLLPNLPETVVAMLSCASIGAVWSSCSPDFGIQGIIDRFGQIEPKVIVTADGYFFKGKRVSIIEKVREVREKIGSIQNILLVNYTGDLNDTVKFENCTYYDQIPETPEKISFEQVPFNHPLYIMYSSGTTGLPKCIVHGAGGTLLEHLKELVLHTDLKREDNIFYFTTCGWMMWNWLVSSLAVGATVSLYDGSPFYPNEKILFDFIDEEKITVFGTSAKYITAIEKAGVEPLRTNNISSLRTILSTGSPLVSENYDYVYTKVKKDVCLSSISGGTDIIGCFALGSPINPVYRGELQVRSLGLDVQVFNEKGEEVVGEKGELVCKNPFPSMPIYFWNDPENKKYRAAYFERFPGLSTASDLP